MLLKNMIVPKKSLNVYKNKFFTTFNQIASNVRFKQTTFKAPASSYETSQATLL